MSTQQREEWIPKANAIGVDLHREIVLDLVYQLSRDNQITAIAKFAANRLSPGPFARSNLQHTIMCYVQEITNFQARIVELSDTDDKGMVEIRFISTWARDCSLDVC